MGNGGSAAEAQHLTAELVGRFETARGPLSAICLHGDASALTAIANDFGIEQAFARQVHAHGRPGDVLVALEHVRSFAQRAGRGARGARVRADGVGPDRPGPEPAGRRCATRCVAFAADAHLHRAGAAPRRRST